MNLETTWDVAVTLSGGVALTPQYADGGHVFQLTAKDAQALARKLLKAASKAKAKGTKR